MRSAGGSSGRGIAGGCQSRHSHRHVVRSHVTEVAFRLGTPRNATRSSRRLAATYNPCATLARRGISATRPRTMATPQPQDPQVAKGDERGTSSRHLSSPPILDEKRDTSHASKEDGHPTGGWTKKLPTWISRPLSSPDDLKVLFRCWAILFGSTALLLAHPSLRILGNAALFVVILNVRASVYFALVRLTSSVLVYGPSEHANPVVHICLHNSRSRYARPSLCYCTSVE